MSNDTVTTYKLAQRLLLSARVEGDTLVLADAVIVAALWCGSSGMLRAADDGGAPAQLATDDGYWRLHFVSDGGGPDHWRVIVALDAAAPFAASLMREQPLLRVLDGGGAIVLQGRLDADGECEGVWPFSSAPAPHFQAAGATFAVEPLRG